MIKKIKAFFKRFLTYYLNKDSDYQSKSSEYGNCSVQYIDGINILQDTNLANIIISATHDNSTDAISDLTNLIALCTSIGLRVIQIPKTIKDKNNINGVYITGTPTQFSYLLIRYEEKKSENHFFSLLYNTCKEIDLIAYMINESQSDSKLTEVDYYPYMQEDISLTSISPIYVFDPSNTIGEQIDDLIIIYLYDTDTSQIYSFYLTDLKFISTLQDHYLFIIDMLNAYGKEFTEKFTLNSGKNIITDNLLITNIDNDSYYEQIDEIIE